MLNKALKPKISQVALATGFAVLGMLCFNISPAQADEAQILEARHKVDNAAVGLDDSCRGLQYNIKVDFVNTARDTLIKKCEKDQDCKDVPVSLGSPPVRYLFTQLRGQIEPVITNEEGKTTTLEKIIKSNMGKHCNDSDRNWGEADKFYTFESVEYVKPDDAAANLLPMLDELAYARKQLEPPSAKIGSQRLAGFATKSVVTGTPDNGQGQPASPRILQAPPPITQQLK